MPIARQIEESEGCPWAALYSSMILTSSLMPKLSPLSAVAATAPSTMPST
jgi:hypothetical protein